MARPRSTVRDNGGREVFGLSEALDKGAGKLRYYITGTRPPKWLGYDRDEAIRRFLALRSRQEKETIVLADAVEYYASQIQHSWRVDAATAMRVAQEYYDERDNLYKPPAPEVDADLLWLTVRNMILTSPKDAANRTGIPELAFLERLEKPAPSLRFNQALDLYLGRPTKKITDGERDKLASYWREFATVVGVTQIEDVTRDAVEAWASHVSKAYIEGAGSPKSVAHKITRVRTILRYASEKGHKDCTRVLGMVKAIDMPSARRVAPKPISRTDYHALLNTSDARWRAILLTAMNCCYYAADIRQITKDVIDRETGEVAFPRPKTNVARVAMLWGRTREALAEMQEHNLPAVFISGVGAPYKANGFRSAYDRLRTKAGVSATFSQIRDGAYTAAIRGGADITTVRMLAGHSTGMPDHYVLRGGEMVKGACEAIEKSYFG